MGTTKQQIAAWFDEGVTRGATHMIVVCDTFDHEEYPVFVKKDQDARAIYAAYNGKDMQRVMEIYSLTRSKAAQLAEHRAFHLDALDPDMN